VVEILNHICKDFAVNDENFAIFFIIDIILVLFVAGLVRRHTDRILGNIS
jgi:hypothetical protein